MSLKSLSYTEFDNNPRHWKLESCDFTQINLIVGRNATGKTRLMNVINNLCKILSVRTTEVYLSGTYQTEIVLSGKTYALCLEFASGHVIKELLEVDGNQRLPPTTRINRRDIACTVAAIKRKKSFLSFSKLAFSNAS